MALGTVALGAVALGGGGLRVSRIGLGCMGMTGTYGAVDEDEALRTVHRAIERGVTLIDTAEGYGPFRNEAFVGRALEGRRDRVALATKIGFAYSPEGKRLGLDSRPERIAQAVDGCLGRLRTDRIDLLYQHRVDPATPIEDTVGAMQRLVEAGKVRFIGLSEASPRTLARAHAVHPISALQSEYSLWERAVAREVLPCCRQLGVGFVAYAPLGRGFLTGTARPAESYPADDYRRLDPRLQGDNFAKNRGIADRIRALAVRLGSTPAALAVAWLLHQGDDVVPIPGSEKRAWLEENLAAAALRLSPDDLATLDAAAPIGATAGPRWGPGWAEQIDKG